MSTEVKIEQIIKFLEKKHDFSFIGNEKESVNGFSTLFNYKENTMTFVSSLLKFRDYTELFREKKIALIITDSTEAIYDCFLNVIQLKNPKNAFFSILDQFFEENFDNNLFVATSDSNICKKYTYISDEAVIGQNVKIGFGCVIEGNVYIGDNTYIHHNVVIMNKTKIGRNCTIFSGTIIGERGFNPSISEDGGRRMLKHYGGVTIEDDVHIGDNCCIIRGAIDDTIIKMGAKLNTMVHIAHNCVIGENTVITAPTHICGSVTIGENCHIAASVIRNQCNVGDGAIIGLGAVVVKDVSAGETVIGNPAKPIIK